MNSQGRPSMFSRTADCLVRWLQPIAAFHVTATDSRRHTRLAKTDTLGDLSQSPVVASGHSLEGHRHAKAVTDVIPTLQSLYYEMASTTAGYALASLQKLVDPTHILWGSDLPFVYGERLKAEVDHWEAYDGFDAAARSTIERRNALRLFPRFGRAASTRD